MNSYFADLIASFNSSNPSPVTELTATTFYYDIHLVIFSNVISINSWNIYKNYKVTEAGVSLI